MFNLYYRNRRLLILTVGLILVAGLSSYYVLPRMEDPPLSPVVAMIHTVVPAADAKRVETLVTKPLEEKLREIAEIKELRSGSASGISTITMELRDDVAQPAEVWSRIRDKINDAALPEGLQPRFEPIDLKAYALIVGLTWTGDSKPSYAILRRTAEELKDALAGLRGTEDSDVFGDPNEEIVVEIDPAEIAALGLSVRSVAGKIRERDAKESAGLLRGKDDLLIKVDELSSLAQLGQTRIHSRDGRFVLLADVARIKKGIAEPPGSVALIDGRHAVVVGAKVRNDHRIDHWTTEAKSALDEFQQRLPRGIGLSVVFEQNHYVALRLDGLMFNLLLGGLAVTAVIFVMMGWRSALVVAFVLPLSALMVVTGLRWLDVPIHQISVTGLIIALGLLIDNAIVIVDEVRQRLRNGLPPAEAVAKSTRHLAVPLFGSTLTTALAFAPLALMEGPSGEFVGSIAVSVILAIGSSFLLAMTVTPALTAIVQRTGRGEGGGWWREGFSHAELTRRYRAALNALFRRPAWGVALSALLPLLGFAAVWGLKEQFFPPADRDQFQIELEMPPAASLDQTLRTVRQVRAHVLKNPRVKRVDWFIGESAPSFFYNVIPLRKNASRYAQALVRIDSAKDSRTTIHQLQDELDDAFPQARVLVKQLEQGPGFAAPVEVRLYGPDLERLKQLGAQVREHLAQVPNVIHTRAELGEPRTKLALNVDEEQARLAGLSQTDIASQLHQTLQGEPGGSIMEGTEELPIRVRAGRADRAKPENVMSLDVMVRDTGSEKTSPHHGHPGVPLSALAGEKFEPQISAIPRLNGRRMYEVQGFITAGTLPAEVVDAFQKRLTEAKPEFKLPAGYRMDFGGEAAKRNDAIGLLLANIGVLMVLMAATLVLSFGSFRIAGLIGAVAVLSVGLGLAALWLFGYPFGFMAIIGTMGLIGVAINDTIVVLAAIRENSAARGGDARAMADVVMRSTRHVLATSLTTMAGFAPLILGGGGFWPPLAVAIGGGVGGATILALVFIPAAYRLVMCRGCDAGLPRNVRCFIFSGRLTTRNLPILN